MRDDTTGQPEGSFVEAFANRLPRYGDLAVDENLRRFVDDIARCETLEIARHSYPQGSRFDVTPELIMENLPARHYAGVVQSVFKNMADLQGKRHIGNKNPGYWRCLPLLESLFPGRARYLVVLRDGRDVALSLRQFAWGENNAYAAARTWVHCLATVEEFKQRTAGDRVWIARYEQLLAEPRIWVDQLVAFLGTDVDPNQLDALVTAIETNPLRENFSKWRTAMSANTLRVYESVAGSWLRKYCYDTFTENPSISLLERAWYSGEEYARRGWYTLTR